MNILTPHRIGERHSRREWIRHSAAALALGLWPGCATLLDVETTVPSVDGADPAPIWEIEITAAAIRTAEARLKDGHKRAAE